MMAKPATTMQLLIIASVLLASQAAAQDIGMEKIHHLYHALHLLMRTPYVDPN